MTDRAALLIGINDCGWGEDEFPVLQAPGHDVVDLAEVLSRNEDGTENVKSQIRSDRKYGGIGRDDLSDAIDSYLGQDHALFIFYFAGHAVTEKNGGVAELIAGRGRGTNYIGMRDLLERLNNATKVRNTVIILDCCHAGAIMKLADRPLPAEVAIFAAAAENQKAIEKDKQGEFTKTMIKGLRGAAAGHDGRVTVLSLYEYLDRQMTEVGQRPIFATHLQRNITLRFGKPERPHETGPVSIRTARTLRSFFNKEIEKTRISVIDNAAEVIARFAEICYAAWRDTGTSDVLEEVLGKATFGGYLHTTARLKQGHPDQRRYLTWSLQNASNFTLLERLLGDDTPEAKEAHVKDDHAATFRNELLAHWLLKEISAEIQLRLDWIFQRMNGPSRSVRSTTKNWRFRSR